MHPREMKWIPKGQNAPQRDKMHPREIKCTPEGQNAPQREAEDAGTSLALSSHALAMTPIKGANSEVGCKEGRQSRLMASPPSDIPGIYSFIKKKAFKEAAFFVARTIPSRIEYNTKEIITHESNTVFAIKFSDNICPVVIATDDYPESAVR
ncbi:hypothetical protein PVMG_03081 [Plasmodium vivax Mauritania I]|uniref:Uncharacterized protein n=1 Tax=Plasmodium vivax Mauritania I TaxID=1035515 RepID=A0A0J9TFH7_PLAVI|nr:hypothetical protein PVMG_03081 [Plasmodium vivax Mauritania I]